MPSREERGWGPSQRQELDGMGGDARIPIQCITVNEGNESAVSKQEVDTPRVGRPATNAGGLSANVGPLRGNKGVQAMKLLELHVKIAANKARYPPGGLGIHQSIPAKGAGDEKAVSGPMRIAIDIVKSHGVPTPREPHHTHEAGPQNGWDKGDTATAHNDGEEASAVRVSGRQENLTACLSDIPQDGTPHPDTGLLYQRNVPTKDGQVGPTLSKAREVGGDDARTGIGGLSNAV